MDGFPGCKTFSFKTRTVQGKLVCIWHPAWPSMSKPMVFKCHAIRGPGLPRALSGSVTGLATTLLSILQSSTSVNQSSKLGRAYFWNPGIFFFFFWLWNTQSSNISRDKGIQKSEHTGLIILSVGGRKKVWGQNQRNNVLIYSSERLVHHSAKKHTEHTVCVRHCARCLACSGQRQTAALSSSDLHCVLILKQ